MSTTEEGWHTVDDGTKLYTKTWKPTGETKARVVFVHGFSDYCDNYGDFFPNLAENGIEVRGFDQRGWGNSCKAPKEKGLTGPTSQVLTDIDSFIRSVISATSTDNVPLFLMGHSMGGAEILTFASQGPLETRKQIRGYLAESPFLALSPKSQPYKITVVAGRMLAKVMPRAQMVNKLDPSVLSRDPEVCRHYVEDPLCHDTGTLEGLSGMLDRGPDLTSGKVVIDPSETRSIWVSHGTADAVCDFQAVKTFCEQTCKVKDTTFKEYDGWYHRLHAEPGEDKKTFVKDVTEWIMARV